MNDSLSRRQMLLAMGSASAMLGAQPSPPSVETGAVERNDRAVDYYLQRQITDPASPWLGSIPDQLNLHHPNAAGGAIECLTASWVHARSRFHGDKALVERIRLAAGYLERCQSPEGNLFLLTTNYNSPPDTGFISQDVASAAAVARRGGGEEVVRILRAFLVKAGAAMVTGGIHTPNHRWVVSAALAQINEVFPDPSYIRRIDQWLAEGIDVDGDGQFIERSTVTYNTIVDRSLVVMAAKLKRPALLEPVRRNLAAMMYLLHPDGEVVTEVSRRQDQNVRGNMSGYWLPLHYMAIHDKDGRLAGLAGKIAPEFAVLSKLIEYPELLEPLPATQPLPEDYEKVFPEVGLARIRRRNWDASLVLRGNSRFLSMRNGSAAVEAVRFATTFFGKGQFVPEAYRKTAGSYVFRQSLDGPYFQPLDTPRRVTLENWAPLLKERRQTQVCRLEQIATVTELKNGIQLRVQAHGTAGVPLAIEIGFRDGGTLEGCRQAPQGAASWLLEKGSGLYRFGRDQVRFGPGTAPHFYTDLRGAEPKLPGQSVYLTGYTPFDHTITFEMV